MIVVFFFNLWISGTSASTPKYSNSSWQCLNLGNTPYQQSISKILIITQTIICSLIVFVYGLIFIFGSSTNDNKNLIRTYFANEYQIYKWSNSVLPKNSILLSIPRSISFSKVETYSIDFTRFVNSNKEYYWNLIKEKKPNYILSFKELKENNCVEELAYHQKDIGYFTSRNIFQKKIKYDGYIYKFNYNYLPNCYINKLWKKF